ncbi:MAG: hypothetical protein Q4D57_00785 [Clostridia bacterium]|nr:hypothetical protein [Clostridia bacterium]
MKNLKLLSTALAAIILFSPAAGAMKPANRSDTKEPMIKRARVSEDTSDESTSSESASDIEKPEDIPIPEIGNASAHIDFVRAIKNQNREDDRKHLYKRRSKDWKPEIDDLPTGEKVDNWLLGSPYKEDYERAVVYAFTPLPTADAFPCSQDLYMPRMRAWFMYYYKRGKYELPQWVIDLKKEPNKEKPSPKNATTCEEKAEPKSVNQESSTNEPKAKCEATTESKPSLGHALEMSSDQETHSLIPTAELTFEKCAEITERERRQKKLERERSPFYEPEIPAIGNAYANGAFEAAIFRTNQADDLAHSYCRRPKSWKPAIEELPKEDEFNEWLKSTRYASDYYNAIAFAPVCVADASLHHPRFHIDRLRAWTMYYYQRGKYNDLPQRVADWKRAQDEKKYGQDFLRLLADAVVAQEEKRSKNK